MLVTVKVEDRRRSLAYSLDTEKKSAKRERDAADLFGDPYNPIHWLPRATAEDGVVVFRGDQYKVIGRRK